MKYIVVIFKNLTLKKLLTTSFDKTFRNSTTCAHYCQEHLQLQKQASIDCRPVKRSLARCIRHWFPRLGLVMNLRVILRNRYVDKYTVIK